MTKTTRSVVLILRGDVSSLESGSDEIPRFILDQGLKAAAAKLPCYTVKAVTNLGVTIPSTMLKVLDDIKIAEMAIRVTRDGDSWSTTLHVSTTTDRVRRCDMVDLFGVAGSIGLAVGGRFSVEEVEAVHRLVPTKQKAILHSSHDLDPRTDIMVQDFAAYNAASKRPYLDLDSALEAQITCDPHKVKMISEKSVYERIANH